MALVQLLEYFLWNNLNNKFNKLLSKLIFFDVFIQVPTIMLMIQNQSIKYTLLIIYFLCFLIYSLFKKNVMNFQAIISKTGHLSWEWVNNKEWSNKLNCIYIFLCYFIIANK